MWTRNTDAIANEAKAFHVSMRKYETGLPVDKSGTTLGSKRIVPTLDPLGEIDQFIAAIDAACDIDEVFVALRRQIDRLGFERFAYWLLWSADGPPQPFRITSYSADWARRYREQEYGDHDIVGRHSVRTIRPFLWQEVNRLSHLTPVQRLVFNEGAEAGLKAGGSVPIHGPGTAVAAFSVANDLGEEEFTKLFLMHRHEIQLIATYAHERILSLGMQYPPRAEVRLTPREIEILTWTARGKTRWEISEILAISEHTVKDHLEHACLKLDASNKLHATAIALIHGLILP